MPTGVLVILGIMGRAGLFPSESRLFGIRAIPFITFPIVLPHGGIPHIIAVGRVFGHFQVLADNLILAGCESYVFVLFDDGALEIEFGLVEGVLHGELAIRAGAMSIMAALASASGAVNGMGKLSKVSSI